MKNGKHEMRSVGNTTVRVEFSIIYACAADEMVILSSSVPLISRKSKKNSKKLDLPKYEYSMVLKGTDTWILNVELQNGTRFNYQYVIRKRDRSTLSVTEPGIYRICDLNPQLMSKYNQILGFKDAWQYPSSLTTGRCGSSSSSTIEKKEIILDVGPDKNRLVQQQQISSSSPSSSFLFKETERLRESIRCVEKEKHDAVSGLKRRLTTMTGENGKLRAELYTSRLKNDEIKEMKVHMKNREAELLKTKDELKATKEYKNNVVAWKDSKEFIELSQLNKELKEKLHSHDQETANMVGAYSKDLAVKDNQLNQLKDENNRLKVDVDISKQSISHITDENCSLMRVLEVQMKELQLELEKQDKIQQNLKSKNKDLSQLLMKNSQSSKSLSSQLKCLKHENAILKSTIEKNLEHFQLELTSNATEIQQKFLNSQSFMEEYRVQLDRGRIENMKLFNTIQDLRGNIRVICRMRPLSEREVNNNMNMNDSTGVEESPLGSSFPSDGTILVGTTPAKQYAFDHVFSPHTNQSQVFAAVEPLVRSVYDGFNACIFAYGQTGSGKTFTMEGTPEFPGINAQAIELLFRMIAKTTSSSSSQSYSKHNNTEYSVNVSMVEIYNDSVIDLLKTYNDDYCCVGMNSSVSEVKNGTPLTVSSSKKKKMTKSKNTPQTTKSKSKPETPASKIHVRKTGRGTTIEGVVGVDVSTAEAVIRVCNAGSKARSIAATNMNSESSRSHMIMWITLHAKNNRSGDIVTSSLYLVDLAGSERVDRSGGTRMKETQHINKSLSALGDVMSSLQMKSKHIPYRNSMLTSILEPSLGGGAKCLMVACVSPGEHNLKESICTLNFASRVASIKLGSVKRSVESGEIIQLKEQLTKVKQDNSQLQQDYSSLNIQFDDIKTKLHARIKQVQVESSKQSLRSTTIIKKQQHNSNTTRTTDNNEVAKSNLKFKKDHLELQNLLKDSERNKVEMLKHNSTLKKHLSQIESKFKVTQDKCDWLNKELINEKKRVETFRQKFLSYNKNNSKKRSSVSVKNKPSTRLSLSKDQAMNATSTVAPTTSVGGSTRSMDCREPLSPMKLGFEANFTPMKSKKNITSPASANTTHTSSSSTADSITRTRLPESTSSLKSKINSISKPGSSTSINNASLPSSSASKRSSVRSNMMEVRPKTTPNATASGTVSHTSSRYSKKKTPVVSAIKASRKGGWR